MKKLLVAVLMSLCVSPAFAQGGVGRGLVRGVVDKGLVNGAQISRLVTQQTRFAQQLKNYQLVPLKITATTSVSAALAVPQDVSQPQTALGTLLRSTYMQYAEADHALDVHLTQLNQPEHAAFLYRGMHLSDLKEIEDIWANGLPVGKTGYNSIYMTSNHAVARHYAKLEDGIPVVVMMKKDAVAASLRKGNLSDPYAEKDVPASAISDVFMLLDVNGKPAWHRVMWQDKLVFMPLAEQAAFTPQPPTQHIKITNLPGEPLVKLGGAVDNAPAVLSARLLDGEALYAGIFPQTRQMIVPSALTRREKAAVYRGMYMADLKNVGNLLINGLEINKSDAYPGEIYTTPFLRMALGYAVPKPGVKPEIPVLVRIRLTTELLDKKASVSWGAERVFYKAIPASFLSDVMVFLEVNGKPDWYKVTLENGELIFTPAPSRVFKDNELIRHEF